MSKKRQKTDKRRMLPGLSFEERVEAHLTEKAELLARLKAAPAKPAPAVESCAEACIGMAAAVKHAIRDCGKSREQMVDAINSYFGNDHPMMRETFKAFRVSPVTLTYTASKSQTCTGRELLVRNY